MLKQHENIGIVARLAPISQSAGTGYTTYVQCKNFLTYLAICQVGVMGSSGTVDFSIVQATDSSGTGVKAITGKAATQLTQAGTDDGKVVVIAINPTELDLANSFQYIAVKCVTATAASLVNAIIIGIQPRATPASTFDSTLVDEIVA